MEGIAVPPRLNEGGHVPRLPIRLHSVRLLEPNRDLSLSGGLELRHRQTASTNNLGFVNDQGLRGRPTTALALIGDSYVEVLMVPFGAA